MTGTDWGRPGWWRDQVVAWTSASRVPGALGEAFTPMADRFGLGPGFIAKELLDAIGAHLVGRRVTFARGAGTVALDLRAVRIDRRPVALVLGQLGTVTVEAGDVELAATRLAALHLTARNVHVQPDLGRATVVTAPVHARAELDEETVAATVARRMPQVTVELRDDRGWAFVTGRRHWGHVQVTPRVDGRTLLLDPQGGAVRGRSLTALARRLPTARFTLGADFPSAHLTHVAIEGSRLVVDGVIEEWSTVLTAESADRLARTIRRYDGRPLRLLPAPRR